MPRITVTFKDGVNAWMQGASTSFTYSGMLEGFLTAGTRSILSRRAERMPLREPEGDGPRLSTKGRSFSPKGYYLLEPSFMYEGDFWGYDRENPDTAPNPFWGQCLKDNELSASIEIPGKEGSYRIVLEWFQSTEELSTRPLTDLVQEAVASLSFEEIKDYCIYEEWD
jgi:hypothetical protein